MASINVDLDYQDHPKTLALVGLLGKSAEILPIRLWLYCGKYHAEKGIIPAPCASAVETRIRWWGRPGDAISALVEAGFLERLGDGSLAVHDWKDFQGHIHVYKIRAQKARAAQLEKAQREKLDVASSQLDAGPCIADQGKAIQGKPLTPPKERDRGVGEGISPSGSEADGLASDFWQAQQPKCECDCCKKAGSYFASLIRSGVVARVIAAEIWRPDRLVSEHVFKLSDRLEKSTPNDKAKLAAARDAEAKETTAKLRREREEFDAQFIARMAPKWEALSESERDAICAEVLAENSRLADESREAEFRMAAFRKLDGREHLAAGGVAGIGRRMSERSGTGR